MADDRGTFMVAWDSGGDHPFFELMTSMSEAEKLAEMVGGEVTDMTGVIIDIARWPKAFDRAADVPLI